METQALQSLFDQKMRIELNFPTAYREVLPGGDQAPEVVRFTIPPPRMNFILYAHLPPGLAGQKIQEQVDYFTTHFPEQGLSWTVYAHDQPPNLKDCLADHGFIDDDEPGTIMVLDLNHPPASLLAPPPGETRQVEIRRITDRAGLEDIIQVEQAVWAADFSWMHKRYGDELEIPGYLSMYAAYVDGQPASAAWIYFYPDNPFAGLYGGSTLEPFRGRGLYTALLAARVQEALQRRVRYLMVDAMDSSRPILARHSFQPITTSYPMVLKHPAASSPASARPEPDRA